MTTNEMTYFNITTESIHFYFLNKWDTEHFIIIWIPFLLNTNIVNN